MWQTNSISIFKDFIVEELPDYALVSDAQLLEDCKWFLGIGISKNQVSSQIIDYFDSLGNEKDEVSEYLLCEIAQLYLETNKQDELINLLLNAEHSRFKKIIDEVKQISGGIHYVENAAKKSILQELETKLEAEDLEIVLQRIERKDQKERLKELEEQFEQENVYATFDYNLTGTENKYNLTGPENKSSRMVLFKSGLIASLIILILVFLGYLIFKYNEGSKPTDDKIKGFKGIVFEDGSYCAEVDYYNPNAGRNSVYTLEVEVESNEVTKIYWCNGGWLDEDHFTSELLDNQGECSFTSDRGYEYTIHILGKDCNNLDSEYEYKSKNLPKYSFDEAVLLVGLTHEEIEDLNLYEEDDVLSENDLFLLRDYIKKNRVLKTDIHIENSNDHPREIDNGYITNITRQCAYGKNIQIVTIRKKGIYYKLEVRGSAECTMGTATFDENNNNWQSVYIKQNPNRDSYSRHEMRILDK